MHSSSKPNGSSSQSVSPKRNLLIMVSIWFILRCLSGLVAGICVVILLVMVQPWIAATAINTSLLIGTLCNSILFELAAGVARLL
jgi:hypothetical protein